MAPRPEPLVVVGAGGHGRETISLVREAQAHGSDRWNLVGVVSDSPPSSQLLAALDIEWLGSVNELRNIRASFSVAVGNSATRRRLQTQLLTEGLAAATLTHWSAVIGLDVEMGQGSYIGALTAITSHVLLGDGVQINAGCVLSHDVVLGDYATLAPGVHLNGGVVVDEGATIFAGATVLPQVRIGTNAVVGAGAVVTSDVAPGETVVGVPARPKGQLRG